MLKKALSLLTESLEEAVPYDIDFCIGTWRIIIELVGKNDNVKLITAEILDSDWIIDKKASEEFRTQIEEIIDNRNREYRQALEQALQIREDRYR